MTPLRGVWSGPRGRVVALALFLVVLAAGLVYLLAGRDPDAPRRLGTRAVVVGIDGADWKVIDELAAAGRLPHLQSLRQRGVSGPIDTLTDVALSPVIWTSVATGKTAAKHGITWFMVDQPDGTRVPVRSHNRKVRAIWNLLAGAGRRAEVVGWWATFPAEDVGKGIMVSDALGVHGFGATAKGGDDRTKTSPSDLYPELDPLVPPPQQLPYDFVSRFVHLTSEEYRREMFDPGRYPNPDPANPIHLFQQYAVTAQGYTAITERLLERDRFDLLMVYFEQVDSFSHLFMKYAPPPLDWVDAAAGARFRDTVNEWYVYQDELLGRLLERIDLGETAVFVLSDHGFKSGERRIRGEQTIDPRRAHLDHETQGIFIAAGPNVRRGVTLDGASVLDLTPTVLHYLGFAVAKDMDGKVLTDVFEPAFMTATPLRYLATYEAPAKAAAATTAAAGKEATTAAEMAEREKALAALGYLGGGSSGAGPAGAGDTAGGSGGVASGGEASSPEMLNNMGRILLRDGRAAEALRQFERALELDPRNGDALLNIASIHGGEGKTELAEHFVQRALQVDPSSIGALVALAEVRRDQENLKEAIRLFEEAIAIDDSQPFVHNGFGDVLQRAGRHPEAIRALERALALDPDSALAYYNLGVTHGAQGKLDAADAAYRKALELAPGDPKTLNNLGYLALQREQVEQAIDWFAQAVAASPTNLEARYNLGVRYLEQGKLEEAVRLLEEAARLSPNHEVVNERLGLAYLEAQRAEDAHRTFTMIRRLYPKNWIAALGLAVVYAANEQPELARRNLDDAFANGGRQARAQAVRYPALAGLLKPVAGPG